jgi:hypothetical protein
MDSVTVQSSLLSPTPGKTLMNYATINFVEEEYGWTGMTKSG